ncbi:ArsR/SmtB family transcription factor [Streptomyces sp. NPDC056480]|uniref:ArsR/SmtB family transcription factor n=1 Tax=Streptomyces sp. NPDC056480 TaxID=3345833 RepID=UPI0036807A8E
MTAWARIRSSRPSAWVTWTAEGRVSRSASTIRSRPERETPVTRAPIHGGSLSDVGVSQPTVSHHLRKLKEAGLLSSERRGTWVYYRVEPAVLAAMGALLTKAATA